MNSVSTKILLIEDNLGDAELIREILVDAPMGEKFDIVHVEKLNDGLERLWNEAFDLVFLDLSLPDSHGIDTVIRMNRELPDLPVMVLTGLNDEFMAVKAMQYGAQDYLIKGQITQQVLVRAIRYSIERHRLLRSLALIDEMTSLYNRRGFVTLAEQHIRLANRTGTSFLLIFADMDGLKKINDSQGHHIGSQAIVEAAGLLRSVFRESDIIARLGGDEFAIIATDALNNPSEVIADRIKKQLEIRNAEASQPFQLGLSIGIVQCDPPHMDTIVELLHNADEAMYKQKRDKKTTEVTDDSSEFTPRLYGNIF